MNKQQQSETYWVNAQDTHLAPAEFYQHKMDVLSNFIKQLPTLRHALDIGCGNAEFTSLLIGKVTTIKGIDISPQLIAVANSQYARHDGVSFACLPIDSIIETEHYFYIILCMGLTSCIISNEKFDLLINNIEHLSSRPGYIIMGDSLSKKDDIFFAGHDGYVAKYRDEIAYLEKMKRSGLQLLNEATIAVNASSTIVNKLFYLRHEISNIMTTIIYGVDKPPNQHIKIIVNSS